MFYFGTNVFKLANGLFYLVYYSLIGDVVYVGDYIADCNYRIKNK